MRHMGPPLPEEKSSGKAHMGKGSESGRASRELEGQIMEAEGALVAQSLQSEQQPLLGQSAVAAETPETV